MTSLKRYCNCVKGYKRRAILQIVVLNFFKRRSLIPFAFPSLSPPDRETEDRSIHVYLDTREVPALITLSFCTGWPIHRGSRRESAAFHYSSESLEPVIPARSVEYLQQPTGPLAPGEQG